MKRTVLLLCAALLCAVLLSALADGYRSEVFTESGVTLNFTDEFEHTQGVIVPYAGVEVETGTGIYETDLIYFAVSQEEYDSITGNPFATCDYGILVSIISADNGLIYDDINEIAGGFLTPEIFRPICTVEDCTHFYFDDPDSYLPDGAASVYAEEFGRLKNSVDALFANSEFAKPSNPIDNIVGTKIAFETTDTQGNAVSSEELFGSHEISMVNIWASWCGFCIDEMEELEAINARLAEKDCAVIGLLADGDDEDAFASGLETLKEKGVTYTNILPPEKLQDVFFIPAYPTTYFVSREGIVLCAPVIGAYINQYEPMVEALLAGNPSAVDAIVSSDAEEPEDEPALVARIDTNDDQLYRIIVIDEDGKPVPGAIVQFCSDVACMTGTTDETGTTVFKQELGRYTVHILKAPAEYVPEEAVFFVEAFCDVTIYLYRQ